MPNGKTVDPIRALKAFVGHYDTQGEAAKALRISSPYLSDLLRGNRSCSDKVLAKLGLRRVVVK